MYELKANYMLLQYFKLQTNRRNQTKINVVFNVHFSLWFVTLNDDSANKQCNQSINAPHIDLITQWPLVGIHGVINSKPYCLDRDWEHFAHTSYA